MSLRGVLPRVTPYALLATLCTVATWPILAKTGYPYNVDISGFFPLTPEAYHDRFWPLWNERGGMSTLQFLPALLLELPFLALGKLLGWGMATQIKVRILFGFTTAALGMYALVRYYFQRDARLARLGPVAAYVIPAVAALYYAFNPWSVHRVFHYFLWLAYVFAPLAILALERLADAPSWRRGLVLAGVFALATTDPHNPVYIALALAPFGILRLVQALRRDRAHAKRFVAYTSLAAGVYVLLGAFWILPYAWNALHNPGFGPTYVMSEQMLAILSRNVDVPNVLRVLHNYYPRHAFGPEAGFLRGAWLAAGYAIPLLAVHALILRPRNGTAWTYAALGFGALALGFGDHAPMTDAYRWLLFHAPWGEALGWLFRDPYRWGAFQALAYAVLMALALGELTLAAARLPARVRPLARTGAPVLAVAAVVLFVAPAHAGYATSVYAPVEVPDEYRAANAYLDTQPEDMQVVWMPRMLGATTWGGDRTLEYFDATSSSRAALGPFRPHTSRTFDFLDDTVRAGGPVPQLLARVGADAVVYHNDRNPAEGARFVQKLEQAGLDNRGSVGETPTSTVAASSVSAPYTPASRYALYGDRVVAQTLEPTVDVLEALELRVKVVGEPGPLHITLHDPDGAVVAEWTRTPDEGVHTLDLDLDGLQVIPWRVHEVRLTPDADASDRDNRYEVSYYKVDAYARGHLRTLDGDAWANHTGDAYFEVRGRAPGFITVLENPLEAPPVRANARPTASPAGLDLLQAAATAPHGSELARSGITFTTQNDAARHAFRDHEGPWHWVTDLTTGRMDAIAPFLPDETRVTPFDATVNADHHEDWARGTREYMYYDWGWRIALWEHQHKSWDFDGDNGLVYTRAQAELTVSLPDADEDAERVLLARVYRHPDGGTLAFHAGGDPVGHVDTRAADAPAGFRWVRVGELPAGARAVTLENRYGLQGVSELAAVPADALADAEAAAHARYADAAVTVLTQAEAMPGVAANPVNLPGTGKLARIQDDVTAPFHVPKPDTFGVWLRVATPDAPPTVAVDGVSLALAGCVADCGTSTPWLAYAGTPLEAGLHALTLGSDTASLVDVVAVTNAPGALVADAPATDVTWERVDATTHRVHVNATGPFQLVFTQPYDPGWEVRVDGRDGAVKAAPVDGVVNGFLVDADGPVTLTVTYAPQGWAERGAAVTGVTAAAVLLLAAAPARRLRATLPLPGMRPEEVSR